jgi:leader peptidase (prepilin peptidase) / N-methyltransferase
MPDVVIALFAGIAGAILGSFLNVVVLRDDRRMSILVDRSECPHCKHQLSWFELVPILSFLVLGGKCKNCRRPISWQYPAVEALVALLGVGVYLLNPLANLPSVLWLAGWVLLLVVLAVIDLRTQEVPLDYSIAATICAIGYQVVQLGWKDGLLFSLVGAAAGAGSILIIIGTWKLLTKTDGMGIGDAWILAAIGAMLGFPLVLGGLFFAVLSGSLVGIGLLITRRGKMQTAIPFGPFLVLGAFVSLWWAAPLLDFYRTYLWI